MITLKSCPICDSQSVTEYRVVPVGQSTQEIMPGIKLEAMVIIRYFVCQDCDLIFQNPRLSDTEIDKVYRTGYYRQTIKGTEEEADIDEASRAKTDAGIIKAYAKNVTSHLDIGCSRGYLLKAIGAGIKVGVDANLDNLKANNVKTYTKINKVPQKSFDLVTALHVLEHAPYPLDFLRNMASFVKTNGYLVVEVPTWESPGGPLRFAHLYHFEPGVLRNMCAQVGLRIVLEELTPHLLLICTRVGKI